MKTVNANSVLGVMNLFNNEEYYMKAIHALWVLRALVVKDVEYTDTNGCLRYDEKSPKYWLYRLTNELIGRSYVDGYIFLLMQGRPNWNNWNRRTGDNGFLTYNEARTIANIAKKEEMIGALIKLRGGRKINCVMRRFFPSSSVGDRPAPRGCTSTPDERKVTTI